MPNFGKIENMGFIFELNRGRGRGGRGGRGRGRGGKNVTKEDLDKELDQYMGSTKSALDHELDAYMSEKDKE